MVSYKKYNLIMNERFTLYFLLPCQLLALLTDENSFNYLFYKWKVLLFGQATFTNIFVGQLDKLVV